MDKLNPNQRMPYMTKFHGPEDGSAPRHPEPCRTLARSSLVPKFPSTFEALQAVLKLLRLLGQGPFSYDEVNGVYSFTWASYPTALKLVVSTLASFVMFVYFTHIGLKKFFIFPPG